MEKIFSVPLNPKIDEFQFNTFLDFCHNYKDYISDIYFTSRIPPFMQDAMGDVFPIEEQTIDLVRTALHIQQTIGIPVSATFNNITIPPTQQNLDKFIKNFKPLYDAGIKIATIPHTHWMATGQIKAAFPELFVKNTILRDVRTAVEIVNLAKYGFDYINLDRDLMRDKDTLLRLKEAKEWIKINLGKNIQYSLLANEGCLGACPMMVEHFEFNNNRAGETPQYFNDPISRVSCPKWDVEDPAVALKTANISPWKEDWDDYIENLGIDTFKMHGRESIDRFFETIEIVKRYAANEKFVDPNFEKWCEETELAGKPIEIWRDKIRNCKFDCWECQYCDKIHEKKSPYDHSDLVKHVVKCILDSGIPKIKKEVPGLTSTRVLTLLNSLAQGVGSYLEVGSYLGSTASAVLKDNRLNSYFIDNWQENIQPSNDRFKLEQATREKFLENIEKYKENNNIVVIDSNMFEVDIRNIEPIQMFFYDGPHDYETTKNALMYYYPVFAEETIVVIDDANWKGVVDGAVAGIAESGGKLNYQKLMLNGEEDPNSWWNGLLIAVVRKG